MVLQTTPGRLGPDIKAMCNMAEALASTGRQMDVIPLGDSGVCEGSCSIVSDAHFRVAIQTCACPGSENP